MSEFSLTYFGVRARVEIGRLALAYGGIKYDFKLVDFGDWPALKPKVESGALPYIDLNGRQFAQGIALQTYFADLAGIAGSTPLERLEVNQVSLLREDMLIPETRHFLEGDAAEKEKKAKDLVENHYPRYIKIFNDLLKKNEGPFVLGDKFSLADIVIFEGFQTLSQNFPKLLEGDDAAAIVALRAKVAEQKGIKEYLANR